MSITELGYSPNSFTNMTWYQKKLCFIFLVIFINKLTVALGMRGRMMIQNLVRDKIMLELTKIISERYTSRI